MDNDEMSLYMLNSFIIAQLVAARATYLVSYDTKGRVHRALQYALHWVGGRKQCRADRADRSAPDDDFRIVQCEFLRNVSVHFFNANAKRPLRRFPSGFSITAPVEAHKSSPKEICQESHDLLAQFNCFTISMAVNNRFVA